MYSIYDMYTIHFVGTEVYIQNVYFVQYICSILYRMYIIIYNIILKLHSLFRAIHIVYNLKNGYYTEVYKMYIISRNECSF